MNIFFNKNRNQSIQSLEIFCFLQQLFFSLRTTNVFLKKNRNNYIESLEFFNFLEKEFFNFRSYDKSIKLPNSLILGLLKVLETFYLWELEKISPYLQALTDQVFWDRSSIFYRETMRKFIDGELNALEFAEQFSARLQSDSGAADDLVQDFRKQANIELNPNTFEFSRIFFDFILVLELYQDEAADLETGELSENDLSLKPDAMLEAVKLAFEKFNKYFTND